MAWTLNWDLAWLGLFNKKYYFRQAQNKKGSARTKQREEELYDKKARDAQKHADELWLNRQRLLERISGIYKRERH